MRFDGIDVTADPREADVFVCPGNLRVFEASTGKLDHAKLNRLPYFRGNESRHAFFDISDNFKTPIDLPILFIRCDVRTWMLPSDPNTIQMAWPVENFEECVEPGGPFKFDVSFQGWLSTDVRRIAAEACKNDQCLTSDIACYTDFTGYIYHTTEGIRRRAEFRRSMKESRVALCGESIPGVLPYRFFEAMSAARVPCLIGSDYVLPFAAEIPYDEFIIRIPATEASQAGNRIRDFLDRHADTEIISMGKMARRYWLQYLNRDDYPRTMALAVRQKLSRAIQ